MPKIKTRDVVKGTVKTIDKAAVVGERMKNAYVRTKDKAEHSAFAEENSPANMRLTVFRAVWIPQRVRLFINLTSRGARALKPPKRIFPKQRSISRRGGPLPTSPKNKPGAKRLKVSGALPQAPRKPLKRWIGAERPLSRRQNPPPKAR